MSSDHQRTSNLERRQTAASLRESVPAVVALVVSEVIVASLDLDAGSNRWHLALALLPLVPAVWLGLVQVRNVRRADEYQRIAHLEAMSIGFGVAMFVALLGGLLDAADIGSTAQFLQLTFILGIVAWVGALAIRLRR